MSEPLQLCGTNVPDKRGDGNLFDVTSENPKLSDDTAAVLEHRPSSVTARVKPGAERTITTSLGLVCVKPVSCTVTNATLPEKPETVTVEGSGDAAAPSEIVISAELTVDTGEAARYTTSSQPP